MFKFFFRDEQLRQICDRLNIKTFPQFDDGKHFQIQKFEIQRVNLFFLQIY